MQEVCNENWSTYGQGGLKYSPFPPRADLASITSRYYPSPRSSVLALKLANQVTMETVRDISKKVVQEYKKSLTTKVLLVDGLIAFSLTTALIQVTYILYTITRFYAF